jgi:NAD(P)-dependent dehydrogenase (short-subunit alcohol dehydrogenase family)
MNILITGGASGLGASITAKLAVIKTNLVFITYYKAKEQALELEQNHTNIKAIYCDFTSEESLRSLLQTMEELNLQVLINNAIPFSSISHFHKKIPSSFIESFESNVLPFIKISQKAVTIFRTTKYGKLITILSSSIINKPPTGWSQYVAEKNYIYSICKSIAIENANFNITSNCISPSFMLTDLNKNTDERIIEDMIQKHPLKRLLTTDEAADSVVFMVNSTQQMNGVNLILNAASDII